MWDGAGFLSTHEDLLGPYDPDLHVKVTDSQGNQLFVDPTIPVVTHGTNTAGVLAEALNGLGGVGVAFGVTFAGISPSGPPGTEEYADLAMNELDRFDIANFRRSFAPSFGPNFA